MSEANCISNWQSKGVCSCPDCTAYAAALDAAASAPAPLSRAGLLRRIQKETGQDAITAGRHLFMLLELGVLSERSPGRYGW